MSDTYGVYLKARVQIYYLRVLIFFSRTNFTMTRSIKLK